MGYFEMLSEINKIKDAMLDEKSKILFNAKIDYMITRDQDQFWNITDAQARDWYCTEIEEALKEANTKEIIIFGAGHDGKRTKQILENCNYVVKYFCDSSVNKVGTIVEGVEVISVDDVSQRYRDFLIVLGSALYAKDMYHLLKSKNFPTKNILSPKYGRIIAQCGIQYFDVFDASKDEIFIDGGAYNGDTILDFVRWTKGTYNKIYAFEPIEKMYRFIIERIGKENLDRIKLYNNALWDKKENLHFAESEAGSCVAETGMSIIQGIALDEIVKDENITFIKMDIEGSELKALEGARNTIIRNKPKLAICIYHKPEDIIEVPFYLLSLVPEYKFYIRHYSSCLWETVLYAEAIK